MPRVTLYTRAGCHLCDEIKQQLQSLRGQKDFELEEIDIDADPGLRERYNDQVPVVAINGQDKFRYRLKPERFLRELSQSS